MDNLLRYRVQMLPAGIRNSRHRAVSTLSSAGWSKELLEREIDEAVRWAIQVCWSMRKKSTAKEEGRQNRLRVTMRSTKCFWRWAPIQHQFPNEGQHDEIVA